MVKSILGDVRLPPLSEKSVVVVLLAILLGLSPVLRLPGLDMWHWFLIKSPLYATLAYVVLKALLKRDVPIPLFFLLLLLFLALIPGMASSELRTNTYLLGDLALGASFCLCFYALVKWDYDVALALKGLFY